ncbi:uncharacterized protein [Choristoneura fumiferana]|uniref:uncharacterized protein n=1 Tax=Choristoneura fumiferana TaxID=7141 RepID=UPI003D15D3DA
MGNCIGGIMSNVIYFSEKFSMFLSFTCLISCSIICMISMLAFGIGLGYNYSYVDFKTKHIYIAESFKKTRPTNYIGPGHYKPTKRGGLPVNPPNKPGKRRWHAPRSQMQSEAQEPKVVEFVDESRDDLPYHSAVENVEMIPVVTRPKPFLQGFNDNLRNLYFSTPTLTLRFNITVTPQDNSTTDTAVYYVGNNTKYDNFSLRDQTSKASNNTVIDEIKHRKDFRLINVNVTKTREAAPPFVLKTVMYKNQLMKWLSRLQDSNKTFAVHVVTN